MSDLSDELNSMHLEIVPKYAQYITMNHADDKIFSWDGSNVLLR